MHLRGKLMVPYSIEGAAAEGWAGCAHGGNIIGGTHPPWLGSEPQHQQIGDSDSRRVQIAVVAQLAAGLAQVAEQKLRGGSGLPCSADERQAARCEALGRGCDDAGIFANRYRAVVPYFEDPFVRPSKLANGEMAWLARVRHQVEQVADERRGSAAQVEHQHRRGEFVDHDADNVPQLASEIGRTGWLKPLLLRDRPQTECRQRSSGIERVAVAGDARRKFGQWNRGLGELT